LAGGQQVSKDSLRVEAYGTVDELNASVGLVRAMNEEAGRRGSAAKQLEEDLRWVQNKLFDVGSLLATAPGQTFKNMPTIKAQDAVRLERLMDRCQKELAPLKEFILPGGGRVSATLHQARTICRRAERICVRLAREETLDAQVIKFLNRLSDALFVWARWVAKTQGEPEFLWERNAGGSDGGK
jgi:cob(I)alamin adenosyltransferase